MVSTDKVKYLIVGAGISGLSFAHFINSNDYLIIERENEAGGYCRTIKKDGFVWDYAGHFFHFQSPQLKKFFDQRVPIDMLVKANKCTKIYYSGKFIDYPFQKNIHQLDKEEFIDCLYYLFKREEKMSYDSFYDMLYGKFGYGITEKFLKPYNEKLYACNLDILDQDAMGRFFPFANICDIINNMKDNKNISYNDIFYYPKEGAYCFIKALLSGIDKNKLSFCEELLEVNIENHLLITNKRKIQYEYLINTSPFPYFIKTIDEEQYDSVSKVLTFNRVLVFNLGFDKKSQITDMHWFYVPDKRINFYRVGFYDNILNQDRLSLYVEIGLNTMDEILVEEELSKTIDSLKRIGVIYDHKLLAYSICIMSPAYVHISNEGRKIYDKLTKQYINNDVYSIGRYGGWKYCSIEDCMVDALSLAELI